MRPTPFSAEVHDASDDRRDDERYDHHLQCVHEELPYEVTKPDDAARKAFASAGEDE